MGIRGACFLEEQPGNNKNGVIWMPPKLICVILQKQSIAVSHVLGKQVNWAVVLIIIIAAI